MVKRFREDGAALRHGLREDVTRLVREHFADFGPALGAEKLLERHGLKVSRETLRGWMAEDGLWLSRKQRRAFHQPCRPLHPACVY